MIDLEKLAATLQSLAETVGLPPDQVTIAGLGESVQLTEVKNLVNPHPPEFKTLEELHDHLIQSIAEFSQLFGQIERQLGAIGSFTGNAHARAEKSKDPALFEKIRKESGNYFRGAAANLQITAQGVTNFADVLLPHYWQSADKLLKRDAHRWSQTQPAGQAAPKGDQWQRTPAQKRETQPSQAAIGRETRPSNNALGSK